jgi:hypothetical protein
VQFVFVGVFRDDGGVSGVHFVGGLLWGRSMFGRVLNISVSLVAFAVDVSDEVADESDI